MIAAAALVVGFLGSGAPVAKADPPTLATYQFTSPGWATFGIVLPEGEAVGGLQVGSLQTQTDVKNLWPDGSIRYAILTTHITDTGSYPITQDGVATGTFAPVVPQARLTLSIEQDGVGTPWQDWVSDLPSSPTTDLWLDGPLVKEWRVRTAPEANGSPHPFLTNIWDVRVYNDGTGTVDATVENVRDVPEADGVVMGVDITVNGQAVYHHDAFRDGPNTLTGDDSGYTSVDNGLSVGAYIRLTSGPSAGQIAAISGADPTNGWIGNYPTVFTPSAQTNVTWQQVCYLQYGSRWHKVVAVGGFQAADVVTDFSTFIAAGAIPQYLSTVSAATQSAIDTGQWQSFDLTGFGVIAPWAYATGYRPELYLYPEWAARYVVHGTDALRAETLAYGDISGSFGDDFTRADPSVIPTLDDNVNYWADPRSWPEDTRPLNDLKGDLIMSNNAHKSSLAYIPYLVTGDRYYSDQMMFDANWGINSTWPGGTAPFLRGAQGMLWGNEIRGFAWAFRDVTDAAFYLPDDNPYKAYFTRVMNANLSTMDGYVATLANPLKIPLPPDGSEPGYARVSLWQLTYLAWAFDHAISQNDSAVGTDAVRALLNPTVQALTNSPDFLPECATAYYLRVAVDPGGGQPLEYYTSWGEVFDANFTINPTTGAVDGAQHYWSGYLGPEARISTILAKQYAVDGAQQAYDYVATTGDGGPDYVANMAADLNQRSALAIADWTPPAPVVLDSIAVTTAPTRTSYIQGDSLDLSGLAVSATYSDGTINDVTPSVSTSPAAGATLATAGTQTVTVSYAEAGVTKTTTFDVSVNTPPPPVTLDSITVTSLPAKTAYAVGDRLDLSGLVVEAAYSDGSLADVTPQVTTAPADGVVLGTAGTQTVQVSYKEGSVTKTTTFDVQVAARLSSDSRLTSLSVDQGRLTPAFDPAVTDYTADVGNTVASVTISAAADAGARIDGAGKHNLAVGDNVFKVVVTAADGTKTVYTVIVTRAGVTPAVSVLVDTGGSVLNGWPFTGGQSSGLIGLAMCLLIAGMGLGGVGLRARRIH